MENAKKQLEQIARIKKEVGRRFEMYKTRCNLLDLEYEEIAHVIDIGTSIMCTKWKIGPEGGSFVQAVVANDLMGAFSRADDTNIKAVYFYTMLMYNMSYIE